MNIDTNNFDEFRICLVQDCNLRCKYCSTGFGRWGKEPLVMNKEIIKKSISFMLKNSTTSFMISFSGGETLAFFSDFKYFVDTLTTQKGNKKVLIGVATNGTTLSKEITDYLINNKIKLTFSIDGNKKTNDRNRLALNNQPKSVYDSVIKGFHLLNKSVGNEGLENYIYNAECSLDEEANLYDSVQHLFNIGFTNVLARPVQNSSFTKYKQGNSFNNYLDSLGEITKEILGNLDLADLISGNYNYMLVNIRATILQFYNRENDLHCNAIKNSICINADGTFVPCYLFNTFSTDYLLGDIYSGFKSNKASDLLLSLRSNLTPCKTCSCEKTCHKCYLTFVGNYKPENTPDECKLTRESQKIIMDIASKRFPIIKDKYEKL
ncbi:MAG: radical SAM protein [Desulfobacterales bacterium]|nr:radical SAM protein [Desulfobacterales bacterium]